MKTKEWKDLLTDENASSPPVKVLRNKTPEAPMMKDFILVLVAFLMITALSYIAYNVFGLFH